MGESTDSYRIAKKDSFFQKEMQLENLVLQQPSHFIS